MKHYRVCALQLTHSCTIRKHTVQYSTIHLPFFISHQIPGCIPWLSVKKRRRRRSSQIKMNVFSFSPSLLLLCFHSSHSSSRTISFTFRSKDILLFFSFGIIFIIIYYYLRKTTVLNTHMKKKPTWRKKQTDECRDG